MTPSSWLPGLRSLWERRPLRRRIAARRTSSRRRSPSFEPLEDRLVFALTVDIIPNSVPENGLFFAATVYRNGSLAQPLTVSLTSSHPSKLSVPATVQIPANMVSKNFNITLPNDTVLDGDVLVTVTATATGHTNGKDTLLVLNDDYVNLRPAPANDTVIVGSPDANGQSSLDQAPWEPASLGPARSAAFPSGAMVQTAAVNTLVESAEFLSIDLAKTYALTGWAKSGDELGQRYDAGNEQSFGFRSYDADHLLIRPEHVLRHLGSIDTRLAAPLNPGDTVIRLQNASGWNNTSSGDAVSRGIAWYGYQDGHGTTYADYTYTRNVALGGANGLWSPGGIQGNVITLNAPWNGPALAAGAAVRNAGAGTDANWSAANSLSVPGDWTWTKYGAVFGGQTFSSGLDSGRFFRPGTAYVKPVLLVNEHGTAGNFIQWRDVLLTEVPADTQSEDLAPPIIDLFTISGDQRHLLDVPPGAPYSWSGELIKVNKNERYVIAGRSLDVSTDDQRPLGFASLDVDKNLIHPLHVTKFATALDTTLAAVLKPGDTSFLVINASGWSNAAAESAETRALAWYGYQDSTGHIYANYTYTRNVAFDLEHGLWNAGAIQYDDAAGAYRVVLREPWTGPTVAAGSAIRNASSGRLFNQPETELPFFRNHHNSDYSSIVGGGEWQHGQPSDLKFRPGTAYIQPVFATRSPWLNVTVAPLANAPTTQFFERSADHRVLFDLDVLGKGALGGGRDIVIESVAAPRYGAATLVPGAGPNGRTTIQYASQPWFIGNDEISYVLKNTQSGETATFKTTIQVLGGNYEQDAAIVTALVAQSSDTTNVAPIFVYNPGYTVGPEGTLRADGIHDYHLFDAVSDASVTRVARLVSGAAHGSLKLNHDGTFEYTPEAGFAGTDSFRYEVFDGKFAVSAAATINVLRSEDELVFYRLRSLAIAAENYASSTGRLPIRSDFADYFDENGKPYLSWRVHLLPFFRLDALYDQFHLNEPWDSPHNLPLASQMPDWFRDAADALDSSTTTFQIISGEGEPYYWRTVSERLIGPRFSNFTDGASNTLLFVEVGDDQAKIWTKPDDLDFDPEAPLAALGTITRDTIRGVMADASTIELPTSIDPDTFASLVTISGGETMDAGTLRRQFAESAIPDKSFDSHADRLKDLQQLVLAMHSYANVQKRFPVVGADNFDDSGKPFLSWRVHILPYLEQENLYNQFHLDEPWDSPHNLSLLPLMPDVFRSIGDASTSTTTRVMTFTGQDAPFGRQAPGVDQVGPTFAQFVDGTSNTIVLVEAGADRAVSWTRPDDLPIDVNNPFASLGILPADVIRAAFADGEVKALPADMSAAEFSALVTLNGNELYDAATIVAREAQRTGQIAGLSSHDNDLRQIAIAILDFENARTRFPISTFASDGTPLLSWRVHILPYLGYLDLYNQFHRDEPWDSPHNLSLLQYMPDVFRSVGDPADGVATRVQGFAGPSAPFPATGTNTTQGLRFANITDGSSRTISFIEAGSDRAVPWTKPSDTPFNLNNPLSALGDISTVFLTAIFDGRVEYRSGAISAGELKALVTYNGGEDNNNPPALSPVPAIYVHQSALDTRTNEFGADWFDVVLDKAPVSNVVLSVGLSNAALAAVDKPTLTFTPQDWSVPQRVTFRPIDNHEVGPDANVEITIAVVDAQSDNAYDPVANQVFSATIIDDDARPALNGDYNLDNVVDAADYSVWRDALGATGFAPFMGADGDGDGRVTQNDWKVWRDNFGARLELEVKEVLGANDSGGGNAAVFITSDASTETVAAPSDAQSPGSRSSVSAQAALAFGTVSSVAGTSSGSDQPGPAFLAAPSPESSDAALLLIAAKREISLPPSSSTEELPGIIDAAFAEEIELVALVDDLVPGM